MDFIDLLISNVLETSFSGHVDKNSLIMNSRYGIRKYLLNLVETLGTIQVHRSNTDKKIEDIFIEIRLLDYIISERYYNEKFIPKYEEILNKNFNSIRNPISVARQRLIKDGDLKTKYQAIEKYSKIILLGQPGSGKTTILRKICLDFSSGHNINYIPIYISLRNLSLDKFTFKEHIVEIFIRNGVSVLQSDYIVNQLLLNGKFIICFDGLDEVSSKNKQKIIDQILSISSEFYNNKYISTVRLSDYKGELSTFKEIELCEFTLQDIFNFIKKWFEKIKDPIYISNLIEKVTEHDQIIEIATSPLFLSLICIVYEYDLDISSRKTILFKRCVECLLRDWDAQRNFRRDTLYSKLDDLKKISLLSRLSYNLHSKYQIFFNDNDIYMHLEEYIEKYGIEKTLLPSVIQEIKSHYGFIQAVSKEIFAFSHLTFQEYFTANHIVTNSLWKDEIDKHIEESFWIEVFTIGSSILPDATNYINYIFNKNCKEKQNIIIAGSCLAMDPVVDITLKKKILYAVKTEYFNNSSFETRRVCLKILEKTNYLESNTF